MANDGTGKQFSKFHYGKTHSWLNITGHMSLFFFKGIACTIAQTCFVCIEARA